MKRLVVILLQLVWLTVGATQLLAHEGGHHQHSQVYYETWEHSGGVPSFQGNFLMSKGDQIFFELPNGEVKRVAISSLSKNDQRLLQMKIKRLDKLNMQLTASGQVTKNENRWNKKAIAGLFIYVILGGIVMRLFYHLYRGTRSTGKRVSVIIVSLASLIAIVSACKKESESIVVVTQSDPLVIDAVFTPYKPNVSTNWDDSYFYVASNGLPSHDMMVGITSWQQQVPIPQAYTGSNSWAIPLKPALANNPVSIETHLMKGAIAIAANGIPIFNPLNNRGDDAFEVGELDQWGGHCGKADDYHYHIAPLHLQATSGIKPIAYALDGFAVYGSKEPDGTPMAALDEFHGHTGSDGIYHYHGTTTYPYMIAAMRGTVKLDPSTTAPEDQITPQASSKGVRPALTPLNGAVITNFSTTGTNAYSLEYTVQSKKAYVNYSWNGTGVYTFQFVDTDGKITTETYTR